MDLGLLGHNLLAPAFLAFAVGVLARLTRSDLAFPEAMTQALSIYLLFAIGIKGGAALGSATFAEVASPTSARPMRATCLDCWR
jgi:hypothetical protein